VSADPYVYIYMGDNQRTYSGVINSGRTKGDTSKIGNLSRIPNLASEICALCHMFRDIDVFSAFPKAALLGATLLKAPKMS
jgi:hypothetical protein